MNWEEVKGFTNMLGNVTNCFFIATLNRKKVDFDEIIASNDISTFPGCRILSEDIDLVKNIKMTIF